MILNLDDFRDVDIDKNSHLRFLFFHSFPEKMNFSYHFPVGGTESWVVFSDKERFKDMVSFAKQIIALPHSKYDHYTLSNLESHLPISLEKMNSKGVDKLIAGFSDIFKSFTRADFFSIGFNFSGQKEGILVKFSTSSYCLVVGDEEKYYGFWGP